METGLYSPNYNGDGLRIGIVQARFNETIGDGLTQACIRELEQLGVLGEDVLLVTVPGALEIPLALQKLAESGQFDALLAIGAVVRGDTYHFDVVANESASGISRISLDFGIPIGNAILTTESDEQALVRVAEKGRHAARTAIEMVNMCNALEQLAVDGDSEESDA